jgi:hypothetical protein
MTPSFDHASSLGRELRDEKASEILAKNGIEGYARRAHGGIYWKQSDRRGANPLDLVELASGKFPEYFREPIAGVAAIPVKNLLDIVDEVPNLRISAPSRRFAQALLTRFELKGLSKQCDPIGGKRCLSQTLLNSLYIHAHWRLYT